MGIGKEKHDLWSGLTQDIKSYQIRLIRYKKMFHLQPFSNISRSPHIPLLGGVRGGFPHSPTPYL